MLEVLPQLRAHLRMVSCLLLLSIFACERSRDRAPGSAVREVASASSLNGGLDVCLVGSWKSTRAYLPADSLGAEGGANVSMDVHPEGATVVDFTPMAEIRSKGMATSFAIKYQGRARGTMKTPKRGELLFSETEYADVSVTMDIGTIVGSGPPATARPLHELVEADKALAQHGHADASLIGKGGIEASPVFAATSYTCTPEALSLRGAQGTLEWSFSRVKR